MSANFIHLHNHSHYSLLDGLTKIPDLVAKAKEYKMTSLALTDHGNMYGVIQFYKTCKDTGIKPIIGCEVYISPRRMLDKQPKIDARPYHLVLLAKNYQGYKNLIKLVTEAHLKGFYYKPRIDKELLQKYSEGLIGMSACLHGEVSRHILNGNYQKAKEAINFYKKCFGKDGFYLEVQHHPDLPNQNKVNEVFYKLGPETNTKLVATNDCHYLNNEDKEAHEVLLSVQTGKDFDDKSRLSMTECDLSFYSPDHAKEIFSNHPEVLANTLEVAKKCDLDLTLGKNFLPHFDLPKGISAFSYLKKLAREGFAKRYPNATADLIKRFDYELSIIEKTGFCDYFLIAADFINWAKKQGIIVGPGRGSAAGSVVSYCLNIIDLEPTQYNLLFERFLNPERISMPDIDIDFADDRRDEVIEYVKEKYGEDHVAQIITFGTMAARGSIRDTARALGMSYEEGDRISKLIPFGYNIEKAMAEVTELKKIYDTEEGAKRLIDMARKLEGVARHAGTHACGVVISKDPLTEYLPLQQSTRGETSITTQYSMKDVEEIGLLKMDFLGLSNLTVIKNATRIIKKIKKINIEIEKIPIDDKKTFRLLAQGKTTGVFQLESEGMKRYLKQLKPSVFEDIIAMCALYRPGPMESIPDFIDQKHGKKKITYIHESVKEILEPTYGIMIYQEQMMSMSRILAGFTGGESDTLRKGVAKKIKALLDKIKPKFIAGCVKVGSISKKQAEELWQDWLAWAKYGFNKCLTGSTEIINARTGEKIPLWELYENQKFFNTVSLKDDKLSKQKITDIKKNGIKKIYKLSTRTGKTINATGNHPFLTFQGWKNLSQLNVGDRVATARKYDLSANLKIEKNKLIVLGYILAEGNLCHPSSFYFYSKNKEERKDYKKNLEKFNNTRATFNKSKFSIYASRINLKQKSEAVEWVINNGLFYKKTTEKFFPKFVFRLNNKNIALLLGKMFQGDGCINYKNNTAQIFYPTSSLAIARDFSHLLLRLEIISTIHKKKFRYRNGYKIGYTINISRYNNIKKFYDTIGKNLLSEKRKVLQKIVDEHPIVNKIISSNSARGSKDIIPREVLKIIKAEIKRKHYCLSDFAKKYKIAERLLGNNKDKKGYLRETVAYIAKCLNSNKLKQIANSDIYWDEIVDIKYFGKQQTYDLTIENTHNFIANDFIVHNSHAACYALIAYQTAYLKANYPQEFMAALLTSDFGNLDRVAIEISECESLGIKVMPPSVNEGFVEFGVIPKSGNISFGLSAIKGIGTKVAEMIVEERKRGGNYKFLEDFLMRLGQQVVNKKTMESLAKSGAIDCFEERNKILASIEQILKYGSSAHKQAASGQIGLFENVESASHDFNKIQLAEIEPASKKQRLSWEREFLGIYLSSHPLDDVKEQLEKQAQSIKSAHESGGRKTVKVGGVITKIHKIITKNKEPMFFVRLEDMSTNTEVLVFPKLARENSLIWREDNIILVEGRVNSKDGVPKILAEKVTELGTQGNILKNINGYTSSDPDDTSGESRSLNKESSRLGSNNIIYLTLPADFSKEKMLELKKIILANPGDHLVILKIPAGGILKKVNTNKKVAVEIKDRLEKIVNLEDMKTK